MTIGRLRRQSRPHSSRTVRWLALLLFASYAFFMWMYFASESVEALVRHLRPPGESAGADFEAAAFGYAAQWRHGMAGNSPLYMPGFFAVGVLCWLWALGRPWRRLAWEGFALMIPAAATAAALSPWGARLALRGFAQAGGFRGTETFLGITAVGAAQAIYTVFAWSAGVLCLQWSIARRSPLPMLVPLVLMIILSFVRPWTVSEFVVQWLQDTGRGHPPAVLSLVAAVSLLAGMILYQLRRER